MYRPQAFAVADQRQALAFVDAHPFATVVNAGASTQASHVPLLLDRARGEHGVLLGHLALANPHIRALDGAKVLAIFMGPHGYVSPRWYRRGPAVPTWNYAVVQVRGRARLLDAAATRAVMDAMAVRFEPDRQAWSLAGLPPDYADRMLQGIVGFEIDITTIEAKFKMSQNQPRDHREAVIAALAASDKPGERELADFMRDVA